MKKISELQQLILDNCYEGDILNQSYLLTCANKILREAEALNLALRFHSQKRKEMIVGAGNKIEKVENEISKGIGKLLYDLIVVAELTDNTLEGCLEQEYKNRK